MAVQTKILTFDEVRDYVLDAAGFTGACPVEPEVLDVLMLNCLGQIYTQIWDDKHYQTIWNFDIVAGNCTPVDAEGNPICTGDIFDPMWRIINKIERDRDCKELYEASCYPSKAKKASVEPTDENDGYPTKEELVTKWKDVGKVKQVTQTSVLTGNQSLASVTTRCEWFCWGDEFLVTPASSSDESYTIYGYRKVKQDLFLEDPQDPNKIIWQAVDLPEDYHTAYQKCVLGFFYNLCGDTDLAREWLRIASDEINAIKGLNDGELTDRVPEDDGPCYMNGGDRREPYCPPPRFHFEELDGDLPRGNW